MITAIAFFITGIGLLYVSYTFSKKYDKLLKTGKQAEGIVFDFESGGADNVDTPIIRFVTQEQEWITKTASAGFSNLKKGAKVTVLYSPQNPGDFVVKSASTYLFVALFAIVGVLAVFGGLFYLFLIRASN